MVGPTHSLDASYVWVAGTFLAMDMATIHSWHQSGGRSLGWAGIHFNAARARKTVKMHRLPDGCFFFYAESMSIYIQLAVRLSVGGTSWRLEMLSAPHMQQLAKQTRYHKIILICKTIASVNNNDNIYVAWTGLGWPSLANPPGSALRAPHN